MACPQTTHLNATRELQQQLDALNRSAQYPNLRASLALLKPKHQVTRR